MELLGLKNGEPRAPWPYPISFTYFRDGGNKFFRYEGYPWFNCAPPAEGSTSVHPIVGFAVWFLDLKSPTHTAGSFSIKNHPRKD